MNKKINITILKKKGISLLIISIFLGIISSIIASLNYNEMIKYRLSIYQKNSLKSEMLAETGINLSKILLVFQNYHLFKIPKKPFKENQKTQKQINLNNLHKNISIGFLIKKISKELFLKNFPIYQNSKKIIYEKILNFNKKNKKFVNSNFPFKNFFLKKNKKFNNNIYLNISINDEESKVPIQNWKKKYNKKHIYLTAIKLYYFFNQKKYSNLFNKSMTKWILIENIYNYINPKMKTLHSKNNYIKNYYFDSIKELNNVYGFSNKHMSVLKNKLTIYGKNTKININTASDDILKIIIKYCLKSKQNTIQINYIFLNKLFKTWKQKHKKKNKNITLNKFIFFLKKRNLNLSRNCTYAIGEKSKLFTIRSIAKINGTIKKIKIITEILKKNEKTYYYNNF